MPLFIPDYGPERMLHTMRVEIAHRARRGWKHPSIAITGCASFVERPDLSVEMSNQPETAGELARCLYLLNKHFNGTKVYFDRLRRLCYFNPAFYARVREHVRTREQPSVELGTFERQLLTLTLPHVGVYGYDLEVLTRVDMMNRLTDTDGALTAFCGAFDEPVIHEITNANSLGPNAKNGATCTPEWNRLMMTKRFTDYLNLEHFSDSMPQVFQFLLAVSFPFLRASVVVSWRNPNGGSFQHAAEEEGFPDKIVKRMHFGHLNNPMRLFSEQAGIDAEPAKWPDFEPWLNGKWQAKAILAETVPQQGGHGRGPFVRRVYEIPHQPRPESILFRVELTCDAEGMLSDFVMEMVDRRGDP